MKYCEFQYIYIPILKFSRGTVWLVHPATFLRYAVFHHFAFCPVSKHEVLINSSLKHLLIPKPLNTKQWLGFLENASTHQPALLLPTSVKNGKQERSCIKRDICMILGRHNFLMIFLCVRLYNHLLQS